MANILKTDDGILHGPRVLLQRPELAALIGCICADWAYVEDSLAAFYGHLMGVYLPEYPGFEPPSHPVALQVMDELQSVHAKVSLVKKLAGWIIKDENLKLETFSVLDKLRKAGEGRNMVAHGVWGICKTEPDALILISRVKGELVYKKQDFERVLEGIHKARSALGRVHNDFYQARRQKQ